MSRFERLKMKAGFWFYDFMMSLFDGKYKEHRRESRNILSIIKKSEYILSKRK